MLHLVFEYCGGTDFAKCTESRKARSTLEKHFRISHRGGCGTFLTRALSPGSVTNLSNIVEAKDWGSTFPCIKVQCNSTPFKQDCLLVLGAFGIVHFQDHHLHLLAWDSY